MSRKPVAQGGYWYKVAISISGLSPNARLVALTLERDARTQTGQIQISMETLTEWTGLSRNTVRTAIKELESEGFLTRDVPSKRQMRMHIATTYTLQVPAGYPLERPQKAALQQGQTTGSAPDPHDENDTVKYPLLPGEPLTPILYRELHGTVASSDPSPSGSYGAPRQPTGTVASSPSPTINGPISEPRINVPAAYAYDFGALGGAGPLTDPRPHDIDILVNNVEERHHQEIVASPFDTWGRDQSSWLAFRYAARAIVPRLTVNKCHPGCDSCQIYNSIDDDENGAWISVVTAKSQVQAQAWVTWLVKEFRPLLAEWWTAQQPPIAEHDQDSTIEQPTTTHQNDREQT